MMNILGVLLPAYQRRTHFGQRVNGITKPHLHIAHQVRCMTCWQELLDDLPMS